MYILDANGVISQLTTGNSYMSDVKFTSEIDLYDNIYILATSSVLNDALLGKIISSAIASDIIKAAENRSYFSSLLQIATVIQSMHNTGITSLLEEKLIDSIVDEINKDYEISSVLKYLGIDANDLSSTNLSKLSIGDKIKLLYHLFSSIRIVISAISAEMLHAIQNGSLVQLLTGSESSITSDLTYTLNSMQSYLFKSRLYYSIYDLPSQIEDWLSEGIPIQAWSLSSNLLVHANLLLSSTNSAYARDVNGYQHIRNDFDVSWFIKLERVIKDLYGKYDTNKEGITLNSTAIDNLAELINHKEWLLVAASNSSSIIELTRDDVTKTTSVDLNAANLSHMVHNYLMNNNGYDDLIASLPPAASNPDPLPPNLMKNDIENVCGTNFKMEISGDRNDYVIRFNADNLGGNKDVDIIRVHNAGAKVRFTYNKNEADHLTVRGRFTWKNKIYCHDQCELNNDPVNDKDAVRKSYLNAQLTPIQNDITSLTDKVTALESSNGNDFDMTVLDSYVKKSDEETVYIHRKGDIIFRHAMLNNANTSANLYDNSFDAGSCIIDASEINVSQVEVRDNSIGLGSSQNEYPVQTILFGGCDIDTNLTINFEFMPSNNSHSIYYTKKDSDNWTRKKILNAYDDVASGKYRTSTIMQQFEVARWKADEIIASIGNGCSYEWFPEITAELVLERAPSTEFHEDCIGSVLFSYRIVVNTCQAPNTTQLSGSIKLSGRRDFIRNDYWVNLSAFDDDYTWEDLQCVLSMPNDEFSEFKNTLLHQDFKNDDTYTFAQWRNSWLRALVSVKSKQENVSSDMTKPATTFVTTASSLSGSELPINMMDLLVCFRDIVIITRKPKSILHFF